LVAHRGPDAKSVEFYEEGAVFVSFGHRRLSIIDLNDNANQPFHYENHTIVFNGEIYNFLELKKELKEKGVVFKTKSDTEVLIKSYAYWGQECLNKFNGMFSFLIYDRSKKEVFLARDRFGIKPLYYYVNENSEIFFASEIKQIISLDSYTAIGNVNAIGNFIENRYIDYSNETFFHNIFQICGGEAAIVNLTTLEIDRYDWYKIEDSESAPNPTVKDFYQLFKSSIELRLRSDVEVGSCLSGGVDSSSIVCMADSLLKGRKKNMLKTFTSCFDDEKFDEREYVNLTKSVTNIDATYLFPQSLDFFNKINSLIYIHDEPIWSSSIFAQHEVFSSASRAKVKVILDGQGADEVFCGYSGIFYPTYFNRLSKFLQIKELTRSVNKKASLFLFLKQFLPIKTKTSETKVMLLNFNNQFRSNFESLKDQTSYFIKYHLPALLHYEDRNSMANSIESRLPFLDFRLVEFGYHMPDHFKISNGMGKVVIRNAMRGVTPDEILDNKNKKGFVTPQKGWINENSEEVHDQIKKLVFLKFVDEFKLCKILDDFSNKVYDEGLIMRMYTLSKWIDVFNIKKVI
jgi:asparagine synthase (glutamine-hydrolysing)